MPITLLTPIVVVNSIAKLTKWAAVDYHDHGSASIPYVSIIVQVTGNGGALYGLYTLNAFDTQNSLCLVPNALTVSQDDQLIVCYRQLTNAYTAITTAHDNATGNAKAKLTAVEQTMISSGLVDAALSGT